MTVQTAGGPEWPKRDVSPIRASVARVDIDDDKRTRPVTWGASSSTHPLGNVTPWTSRLVGRSRALVPAATVVYDGSDGGASHWVCLRRTQ